jgi:Cu2+-exporting ATPase
MDTGSEGGTPMQTHEDHEMAHGSDHQGHVTTDPHAGHGEPAGHGGHDKHAGHSVAMFRDRFWLSLLLSVPVLIWSEMLQDLLGYTAPSMPAQEWIPLAFGTAVFVYGGSPFLKGGLQELRDRTPGMMLLISLAITVAFGSSLASDAEWLDLDFWWELVLLIDVMLLGHWQEMKAIGQASSALDALAALLPDMAERVEGAGTSEVAIADLRPGDLVLVRPGGRVPADGTIETGSAAFDESMITGESKAVGREAGDRVVAGTVATDSSVRVRVVAVGDDTALAGIRRLVADAQASRSRAQALADRAAAVLFYAALGAGILTFIAWTLVDDLDQAIESAVTVLVIACPHALGLAIPLVIALSTAMSARNGILVKDRLALERMRTVDAVLFDKTGTLTEGRPTVHDVEAVGDDADALLRLAAAVEADSEHPLARAIVAAGRERGTVTEATDFRSIAGRGVQASVHGRTVAVGGPAMLEERGLSMPSALESTVSEWRARGATVLTVIDDDRVAGALALEDAVRPQSRAAVDALHAEGVRVVMITGDAQQVAEAVATELGVDEVMAEVLPEQKDSKVAELQARGLRVAMVGDGVNDAPALARADVGIAIGAGTDVAIESAGVVLASDDPRGVLSVRALSAASYRKMLQNLGWATGYNVLAIPVAAGAFAWAGILMPPAVAAALMSLSTIVVALNAQLLRRLDLRPGALAPASAPANAGA